MKLNAITTHLILQGVGNTGTYDPDEALIGVEEGMTGEEYNTAESFLAWVFANNKSFGHGNIHKVFKEFQER